MNKQISLALIGAGNRGQGIFSQYALDMPHRAKFTAVVEPDKAKRELFATNHNIPQKRIFADYEAFFKADIKDVDGVVIATHEDHRIPPVLKSMEKGYHILVEKPLCTNAADLIRLHVAQSSLWPEGDCEYKPQVTWRDGSPVVLRMDLWPRRAGEQTLVRIAYMPERAAVAALAAEGFRLTYLLTARDWYLKHAGFDPRELGAQPFLDQ